MLFRWCTGSRARDCRGRTLIGFVAEDQDLGLLHVVEHRSWLDLDRPWSPVQGQTWHVVDEDDFVRLGL